MSRGGGVNAIVAIFLVYHQIGAVPADDTVTRSEFTKEMKYLHDHGYHVITTKQALEGSPGVVIHFDDGWSSQLEAIPVLKRYNYPASFFVVTGSAEGNDGDGYLSWSQIRELSKDYDIYPHTQTHTNCQENWGPILTCDLGELRRSKLIVEKEIG